MSKLGVRGRVFIMLGAVLLLGVAVLYYSATQKTVSVMSDKATPAEMILENAVNHNTGTSRFLIISKYACRTCFESMLAMLRDEETGKEIAIIMIGANAYEIKALNAVYRKLHFSSIDEALYKKIERLNKKFAESAFIGIKRNASGALTLYDGEADYEDISARTAAVVDFLLADSSEAINEAAIKRLDDLSTRGSQYPSISARNTLLLRYPQKLVAINFATPRVDTLNAGFQSLNFLRYMVDTTFAIATQNSFLLCERSFENNRSFFDFSLYDIKGFPQSRRKLFRSTIYLACDYDPVSDVLLFYVLRNDYKKVVTLKFHENEVKQPPTGGRFVMLYFLNEPADFKILQIEENQATGRAALPYEFGLEGDKVFGYSYDSTGFQLYHYELEQDFLKKLSETNYYLTPSFAPAWMNEAFAHRYYPLRVEKFRAWLMIYWLDLVGREYIFSKFDLNVNPAMLDEIFRSDGWGARFHNSNLFLHEDLQSKTLKIVEDVELK